MKVSEYWLRTWVQPEVDTNTLAEQLTMAGLEVDSVLPVAEAFTGVVVGQVLTCDQHPNADKLSVCTVDVGQAEPLPIVCGAPNVCAGLKVAVATVGAVLPGEFKIKKSKLRGEPSHGMLCSAKELGMQTEDDGHTGIMELPADAPVGEDIIHYLKLDDQVLDIELTPNRGDCASMRGVAREVGVLNDCKVTEPDIPMPSVTCDDMFPVHVEASQDCPRYMTRIIRGIATDVPTPLWMAQRLSRAGINLTHPVVDICNYVMIELGQPLHAFDLVSLSGRLVVRRAKSNESATLLSEQEVTLSESDLVIADDRHVCALAGVMGGADSGVSKDTVTILLESAYFDPITVSTMARRLNVHSDAAYRFERGVDFELQSQALARASQLIHDILGGQLGPVTEVFDEVALPKQSTILLRRAYIFKVLGIEFKDADVGRYLGALGMAVEVDGLGWQVTVPTYRFDITQEVDLIEELARLHGYDKIPCTSCSVPMSLPRIHYRLSEGRIADALVDAGYQEVITYSFVDAGEQLQIDPTHEAVSVDNPIASDMSVMRTQLWTGLLKTMLHNQNRQISRQYLFEMGQCFWRSNQAIAHTPFVGLLSVGDVNPEQWGVSARRADFYDMKGVIESLVALSGQVQYLRFERSQMACLHPGQSADVYLGEVCVGAFGVCHPKLVKAFGLRQAPVLGQLKLDALLNYEWPMYQPLSKFPAVRRDLALVVSQDISVRDILRVVQQNADSMLVDSAVFDVYEGEHIEKDKKSIALGLTFQDPSRTLIDHDISSVIQNIINALKDELKATLRT